MPNSEIIEKLQSITREIESLTQNKGSYQSAYETDRCFRIEHVLDWIRNSVVAGVENDFKNGNLDFYHETYIKMYVGTEEENVYEFFILKSGDFKNKPVAAALSEELSVAIKEKSKLFDKQQVTFVGLQLWVMG
jgi:hypothetical protein